MYRFTDVPCDKRIVVNTEQSTETLADYVRRVRNERRLSLADVSARSGGRIGRTHINRIENGELINVGLDKLQALAKGLGVSEDEIFAVARGKPLEPMSPSDFYSALEAIGVEEFHAYGGVANLTAEDQQEIIAVIKTMIEQKLSRRPNGRKSADKTKK